MLMGERLVDADIVVTPAEVGGCTRFYGQLKWVVAPGFTPAPVLPVMAFT